MSHQLTTSEVVTLKLLFNDDPKELLNDNNLEVFKAINKWYLLRQRQIQSPPSFLVSSIMTLQSCIDDTINFIKEISKKEFDAASKKKCKDYFYQDIVLLKKLIQCLKKDEYGIYCELIGCDPSKPTFKRRITPFEHYHPMRKLLRMLGYHG